MRSAAVLMMIAAAFVAGTVPAAAASSGASGRVVLLHATAGDVDAKVRARERALGFRASHRYRRALRGFAARLTDAQAARLSRDPSVAAVVPDRAFTATGEVALATGETAPAGVRRIRAASPTTARLPADGAVAVLDTGIDLANRDLDARHGVNCVTSSRSAQDDNGHGTHVAGTIAARNAGRDVVGVAPGTTVYAVKVLNARKAGTLSQILCGIEWVTANAPSLGIRVANMSVAASGSDDGRCGQGDRDLQHQAICRSIAAGVTYVASAGNDGRSLAATAPASYGEVLTATAMSDADGAPGARAARFACKTAERDDRYATYSNFAATAAAAAHVVAGPGTCVVSSKPGGGTAIMTGSSMAAPHVAGAVAACVSAGGSCAGLTPAGVTARMRENALAAAPGRGFAGDPFAPLSGRAYGPLVDAG